MATVSVIKLKIRRGTDYERRQITLDVGEVGYTTDASSRRLFVGDGSTRGGAPAGTKFISGDIQNPDPTLTTAQVGDIVFNATDNGLYVLSGINLQNFPNYAVASAYQFIGTRVDNNTIEYGNNGSLQIKNDAIGSAQINNNAFDYTKGFTRDGLTGPIQINYDDNTIKVTAGVLAVNPSAINFSSINTVGQGIDASNLAFNYLPGAAGVPGTNRLWKDASGYLRIS